MRFGRVRDIGKREWVLTRLPERDELENVGRRSKGDGFEFLGGDLSDPSQLKVRRGSATE